MQEADPHLTPTDTSIPNKADVTEPLPPALALLGTLLTDLYTWLQTEYAHLGHPYGDTEAGFTVWLAHVATEVQRQGGV